MNKQPVTSTIIRRPITPAPQRPRIPTNEKQKLVRAWRGDLRGISYDKKLQAYRISIRVGCQTIHLGAYPNPAEAQTAYKYARKAFNEAIRVAKRELAKGHSV